VRHSQHLAALFLGIVFSLAGALVERAAAQSTAPANAPVNCADLPAISEKLMRVQGDWGELARYQQANSLVEAPAKNEARVVFLGDSITDLWINPGMGGFFPGKPYLDRGISGQTTPQMLVRFRQDVIALRPKVVVILAGINDIAGNIGPMTLEQIEGNLESMVELAQANGIRVVLASVLPVSNYGRDPLGNPIDMRIKRPPERILKLNAWIKKRADEKQHVYLDYFSAMVDREGLLRKDLSDDGLHPNAKGYAIMAPLAEQAIQTALKKHPLR
jgi:lysophospholipase L1-like esterase